MGRITSTVGALALVLTLAFAGSASAETCNHLGASGDWNSGSSWDCGHVPTSTDTAIVGNGDHPIVASDPIPEPGLLSMSESGRIVFQNEAELRVGDMSVLTSFITGAGSLVVEDEFTKGGEGATFFVTNEGVGGPSPDLVLDGPGTLGAGQICIVSDDSSPDHPSLAINATFRIVDPLGQLFSQPFNCTSGPRVTVNGPNGHLIHDADRTSTLMTMVVNDGRVTARQGTLILAGGTGGQTSDGAYLAAEGATLQLGSCCNDPFAIGSTGRIGGLGTTVISGLPTLADGATLDPAVLDLRFGVLTLQGDDPVALPDVSITGGGLNSFRDVTVTDLAVTHGQLERDFVLTVPAGGTFAKTGDGQLFITNFGGGGSPDLVLDTDGRIDGGSLCVGRNGDQDTDLPTLQINQDLIVGAGASTSALGCGSGIAPEYLVNGPDGHLSKVGAGTLQMQNKLGVAGGRVDVANGQTFILTNGLTQSAGLTDIASGGTVQTPSGIVAIGGGVLSGAGQMTGQLSNTGGTIRPAGTLTAGSFTQGAGGTLQIDLATGAQDRLAVSGAASLAGTLAAVPAAGFDPAPSATFPVVTSGSRTGTFATLTGTRLPGHKRLGLEYPDAPDFGATLAVIPPFVVTDCDDPALDAVTSVPGDLVIDDVAGCDAVDLAELTGVAGDLVITDNDSAEAINLAELGSVGGDLTITGNDAAGEISLGELESVAGDLTITDNGDATVVLGSPDQVAGDLTLDTTGSGILDIGLGSPSGNLDLDTVGYGGVTGATAGGSTTIETEHPEAQMRALLPAGAFSAPVPFSITRLDPAALPPEGSIDPVVAYTFEFGVPALNSPAELSFAIRLGALDAATRDALLAALADGRATLATKGDGAYQAFPVCAAGAAPAADGCVRVEHVGDVVRFTGVVGHFSTWAVAIVAKAPTTSATPTPTPGPPPPPAKPAFGARTLVTLTPAARRIRARGPLRVRVANRNAFAVAARVAGRRPKLRARALRVPARASRTVVLRLPKAVQRQLKRRGKLTFRLTAAVTDPAGNRRTVTRRATVRRR